MTGLEANPPDIVKTMSECSLLRNIWTVLDEEASCDTSATRLNLIVVSKIPLSPTAKSAYQTRSHYNK